MNQEFKPIRVLINIAFFLHIASLLTIIIIYLFQIPLMPVFGLIRRPENEIFIRDLAILFVPIAIIFILHCGITISYWIVIRLENGRVKRLNIISILSFIYLIVVSPIISLLHNFIYIFILSNTAPAELSKVAALQNMTNRGLSIRRLALSALLMAAAMSYYYCFNKKNENKDMYNKKH